jgi:LytS/YehU family sensor histidine kinase
VDFEALLPRAVRWLPIGALAGAILVMRERMRRVDAELRDTELTRLRLEQQRVAVQLQVLQSQIEPHFLFNTLATIRRLQQTDPVRGRETLAGFIHYLRSALPEMRAVETTLGREVALIRAYLDVLKVRMGARLEYSIDVPADLAGAHIPPLALATLVENAVKHGLSNLPEGGHLGIVARRDGDLLLVRVADSGVGLTAQGGAGMGLANLRVRLRGLYGEAGRLELASNHPRGVAVTLQVPVRHEHGDR